MTRAMKKTATRRELWLPIGNADELASSDDVISRDGVFIFRGDVMNYYERWPSPITIVVDGPYGLGSFPGDPPTIDGLLDWYRPHVNEWARRSTPETTLWFWNSELGWATVHPLLVANGWRYRSCHIWDKGPAHVAGNANTKTLRKFPVVTEVCVQYVREAEFYVQGRTVTMQEWLRHEWRRTGLPFHLANEACGVQNAATRKYLTGCHLWYYPPVEAFVKLAEYANLHGDPKGRPYFSRDGKGPVSPEEWEKLRAKFHCAFGVHNVWREPPVNGTERIKVGTQCAHMNQKPLRLLELIIRSSSDPGDVVWEPFGGLCSTAIAARRTGRKCYSSELLTEYFREARKRLLHDVNPDNAEAAPLFGMAVSESVQDYRHSSKRRTKSHSTKRKKA